MPPVSEQIIRGALATVIDPELRRPLTELDMVEHIDVSESEISVTIALTIVGCPASERIRSEAEQAVTAVADNTPVSIELAVMDTARRQALIDRLRGGKTPDQQFGSDSLTRIIAVTSGKGGVGKSTVTANLAAQASVEGLRVGVIDADVFGFSQPSLFGLQDATPTRLNDMILPPVAGDIKIISIGMFVDAGTPVSWRGPMLHRTVNQFLSDVFFGDLDLLLLDLPPGTGDVAISVGQLLPHSEVIVVTTPQPGASDVAIRSGLVARQTGQKVLGVVETMSALVLPDGNRVELFGSGGGERVAQSLEVPLLGQIPLSVPLRESGDAGVPLVWGDTTDPAARAFDATFRAIHRARTSLVGSALPLTISD